MNIFEFVFAIAVVALVVLLIFLVATKKGRLFAGAAIGALFSEGNKNTKIVGQYFDEKIAKLQKTYNNADDAFRKAVGKKTITESRIKTLEAELQETNELIVQATKSGNEADARIFARKAMGIKRELETLKQALPVLEDAVKSTETLRKKASDAVDEMEDRKKEDIQKAELGKTTQEIYSSFDEKRANDEIDRILNEFSAYAEEQEEKGIGARVSWETSSEAQQIAAEERAKEMAADTYINSLINSVSDDN